MTIHEICEPFFQYICKIKRSHKVGRVPELSFVHDEVQGLFKKMDVEAGQDPQLAEQYNKVKLPLIFFTDNLMHEVYSRDDSFWESLAYELDEMAGDEKFFDLLEETFADRSQLADERLAIFYTCLGLGFEGIYFGQKEEIQKQMSRITHRISALMEDKKSKVICADAYKHVDSRDFEPPTGARLTYIGIVLMVSIVTWFFSCFYMSRWAFNDIKKATRVIDKHYSESE